MKGIDFLDIVGEIEEDYIIEAEEKKVRKWTYRQMTSLAASLLLVGTLSFAGIQYYNGTTNSMSDVASVDMSDAGRNVDEGVAVATIESDEDQDAVEEVQVEALESDKNIFREIIENIVSFFQNLRF